MKLRTGPTAFFTATTLLAGALAERRLTWQEGYMPWVAKGPPSIEECIAAIQ